MKPWTRFPRITIFESHHGCGTILLVKRQICRASRPLFSYFKVRYVDPFVIQRLEFEI